jgi:hypothetical protein
VEHDFVELVAHASLNFALCRWAFENVSRCLLADCNDN